MSSFAVALTGGIASGKSATAQRFAALGTPVFDADRVAHELVEPAKPALAEIARVFGSDILDGGMLDRVRLRARVFDDADARHKLESILHPRIREVLLTQAQTSTAPYCVIAIPLYVECRADYRWTDRVLVTDVPARVQIERLLARGIDEALAMRILAAQASRTQRLEVADDLIDNTGPIAALDKIVQRLHEEYLRLAAAR